ncbi:MAG: hypothetical protein RMY29_028110 [Nostoc sp. CreGUA01]|nr:hypothetical protein [Nostoc sp. CreGUA01]
MDFGLVIGHLSLVISPSPPSSPSSPSSPSFPTPLLIVLSHPPPTEG